MTFIEKMQLMAQHMRHHEHLAEKCERGSVERQQHEDLAQQYRDIILCRPGTSLEEMYEGTEKEKK